MKRLIRFSYGESHAFPDSLRERKANTDIHFYSNMAYKNFERLTSLNIFMEKSDDIKGVKHVKGVKDTYAAGFDNDLPYDLVSRPYYVDSFIFNLDRSASSDFDSE